LAIRCGGGRGGEDRAELPFKTQRKKKKKKKKKKTKKKRKKNKKKKKKKKQKKRKETTTYSAGRLRGPFRRKEAKERSKQKSGKWGERATPITNLTLREAEDAIQRNGISVTEMHPNVFGDCSIIVVFNGATVPTSWRRALAQGEVGAPSWANPTNTEYRGEISG